MSFQGDSTLLELGSRELAMGGAALCFAGLVLTPLSVVFARRFTPRVQVFFARWSFQHAALVVAAWVLASVYGPKLLMQDADFAALPEGLRGLLASVLALTLTSGLIFGFASRLDPDGIKSLGLRAEGSLRAAWVGICCFALLLPGLIGLDLLWPWVLTSLGGEFAPQDIAVAIAELSGPQRALAAFLAILVLPFFEELCFRGFLQPLFVQNLGDRGGVFLTSLVFALLHGDSAFLPILALALLLGALALRTQRLASCFAVHAVHNAVVFLTLSPPAGA